MPWLIEHTADVLSKFKVGDDGKTSYERLKVKKYVKELAEFGEKVHYRFETKAGSQQQLEVKWGEGFFMGACE